MNSMRTTIARGHDGTNQFSRKIRATPIQQSSHICQPKPHQKADWNKNDIANYACDWATTAAPGGDGSYGENEPGIFFTTEDIYITWNGLYQYSDAPLKVDSVTHRIEGLIEGAKPTSVGEAADTRNK